MATVQDAIDRAGLALVGLARRGEAIAEEWQYVTDLETVWAARLREVAQARGAEPIDEPTMTAVDRVSQEAEAIEDPHRAIDWLSTLPQVVLLALGEAT